MTRSDPYGLVVIAGSAGAMGPLRQVLSALPADYPLPVVVVQHRSAAIATGAVDQVLPVERIGPLLAQLGRRDQPTPYWKEPA
jgi:two-component system chemotaxis response regulator CheB